MGGDDAMGKISLMPIERIAGQIYLIRGEKVMLDTDLAELYGVETRTLNQAGSRNGERFPQDFMFRLSQEEFEALRSQNVILKNAGRGQHRKYPPRAFTEQGISMLSSVLRSQRAVKVNIAIMRTFVRLRRVLASNQDLARKLARHDQEIRSLYKLVKALLEPSEVKKGHRI
jgi:hypothetical protein